MRSMESKNTVTLVVPVYGVESCLRRCLDSLLAQRRLPDEIILVDDGSPDASGAICDEYASRSPLVKVIHKENGGLSSARLAGFRAARGELIAFVDSDDYVSPDYVEGLAAPFADEGVELTMCSYATVSGGRTDCASLPYASDSISRADIPDSYILPLMGSVPAEGALNIPAFAWIRMYRRALLEEGDFVSEREYFTEDVILNILYARRIRGKIALIDRPLYFYCVNPGSLTLRYRENAFAMLHACYRLCASLTENIGGSPAERRRRLEASLTAAVTYSIYSLGKLRDYRRFRRELRRIIAVPEVAALFADGAYPRKATWHRIIYHSCRLRLFPLLYLLLKTRKTL